MSTPPPELGAAREQFLGLVDTLRPDLHRYASRLVGSAIDGEDVVQEALAKAFYFLSQSPETPALRPWLFGVVRNAALDQLRRRARREVDGGTDVSELADDDAPPDPATLRAALGTFLELPVNQRSAVILKDVLGESLEDIAVHLGTTVLAVKALLVRGRRALAAAREAPLPTTAPQALGAEERAVVDRYVSLFNAREWDALRELLVDEVRLDLVSKSQRKGKAVGAYFGRYAKEPDTRLRLGTADGRPVLGVFRGDATEPASLVLLEVEDGRVVGIRDFRYVDYLVRELTFEA